MSWIHGYRVPSVEGLQTWEGLTPELDAIAAEAQRFLKLSTTVSDMVENPLWRLIRTLSAPDLSPEQEFDLMQWSDDLTVAMQARIEANGGDPPSADFTYYVALMLQRCIIERLPPSST